MFKDRIFRIPRIWSNKELRKFSHLFNGDVVNVSAWMDKDKEGDEYRNYFSNSNSYTITNYKTEAKGFQGSKNEIFLDLEKDLPSNLIGKFDVVFNHTTLEHIYNFNKAFNNLCLMSKDIVIIIVPFLQQMHADYGDYWRFTPLALKKMFEDNKMEVVYSSFNEHKRSSVYLFFIASKKANKWKKLKNEFSFKSTPRLFLNTSEPYLGNRAVSNNFLFRLGLTIYRKILMVITNYK